MCVCMCVCVCVFVCVVCERDREGCAERYRSGMVRETDMHASIHGMKWIIKLHVYTQNFRHQVGAIIRYFSEEM